MNEDLRARIAALSTRIDETGAAVGEGMMADLTGLDDEVAGLCEEVRALGPNEGGPLLADLDRLLVSVNGLKVAMSERYEAVQAELRAHGRRSRAANAYGRPAGAGGRNA